MNRMSRAPFYKKPEVPAMPASVARAAYQPPASSPIEVPSGKLDDQSETFSQTFPWPANAEQSVYRCKRRWRACDVYLQTSDPIPSQGTFLVRVYAHADSGLRTLVATGRLGNFNDQLQNSSPAPLWICAARAQASFFEVTVTYEQISFAPATGTVSVSLVASDEANEPPEWVGVMAISPDATLGFTTTVTPSHHYHDPELIDVFGVPDVLVAAPRFLHVHVNRTTVVFLGLVPRYVFPLGLGTAGGGGLWKLSLRADSFAVVPSSTADTTTPVADCVVGGRIR